MISPKDCYHCKYFKWYNFMNENVHCRKHEVKQFEFGQILTCNDFEDE